MQITKNLKTIPFDKLYEIYEEAATSAVEGARLAAEARYADRVKYIESTYGGTEEAPSEVSFADRVQREVVDEVYIRRKYGQKAITDVWMPRYGLNTLLMPVMAQIIAHLGSKCINFAEITTPEGKIDPKAALDRLFDFSSTWDRGLYLFLMLDSRGSYVKSQYKEGAQFCALVPLILYAVKLHYKVPYSRWDRSALGWVVNKSLCDAMLWEGPEFSADELIDARTYGLTVRTGAKAGELRNPVTTYKLWSTRGKCLEGAPELVAVMLTQIWCAHPKNRHHYMVLDPKSWDTMPPPLVTADVFSDEPVYRSATSKYNPAEDLPW